MVSMAFFADYDRILGDVNVHIYCIGRCVDVFNSV